MATTLLSALLDITDMFSPSPLWEEDSLLHHQDEGEEMSTVKQSFVRSSFRNSSRNESVFDYPEYQMAQQVWKYGSPVILAVGTVGNFLSILVLCRKRLRKITTMFYLAVLALADLAVLYTGLLRLWLDNTFSVYLRLRSDTACKVHTFFVYFTIDFSVWILVAVTADRCVCVSAPFAAKKWCTIRKARIVVVIIAVVVFLINMHYLFTVSVIYRGSQSIAGDGFYTCYTSLDKQTAFFLQKVWPWIDLFVVCFVPFIVMFVCNLIIIRQLVMSARKLRQHAENELDNTHRNRQKARTNHSANNNQARGGDPSLPEEPEEELESYFSAIEPEPPQTEPQNRNPPEPQSQNRNTPKNKSQNRNSPKTQAEDRKPPERDGHNDESNEAKNEKKDEEREESAKESEKEEDEGGGRGEGEDGEREEQGGRGGEGIEDKDEEIIRRVTATENGGAESKICSVREATQNGCRKNSASSDSDNDSVFYSSSSLPSRAPRGHQRQTGSNPDDSRCNVEVVNASLTPPSRALCGHQRQSGSNPDDSRCNVVVVNSPSNHPDESRCRDVGVNAPSSHPDESRCRVNSSNHPNDSSCHAVLVNVPSNHPLSILTNDNRECSRSSPVLHTREPGSESDGKMTPVSTDDYFRNSLSNEPNTQVALLKGNPTESEKCQPKDRLSDDRNPKASPGLLQKPTESENFQTRDRLSDDQNLQTSPSLRKQNPTESENFQRRDRLSEDENSQSNPSLQKGKPTESENFQTRDRLSNDQNPQARPGLQNPTENEKCNPSPQPNPSKPTAQGRENPQANQGLGKQKLSDSEKTHSNSQSNPSKPTAQVRGNFKARSAFPTPQTANSSPRLKKSKAKVDNNPQPRRGFSDSMLANPGPNSSPRLKKSKVTEEENNPPQRPGFSENTNAVNRGPNSSPCLKKSKVKVGNNPPPEPGFSENILANPGPDSSPRLENSKVKVEENNPQQRPGLSESILAKPGSNSSPICANAVAKPGPNSSPICANAVAKPGPNSSPSYANAVAKPGPNSSPICANAEATPGPKSNPSYANAVAKPGPNSSPSYANAEAKPGPNSSPSYANAEAKPGPNSSPSYANAEAKPGPNSSPSYANAEAKPGPNSSLYANTCASDATGTNLTQNNHNHNHFFNPSTDKHHHHQQQQQQQNSEHPPPPPPPSTSSNNPPPHQPSPSYRRFRIPSTRTRFTSTSTVASTASSRRRPRYTSESLQQQRRSGIPSLTLMLLTVNTVFMLLVAPITVFVIGYYYWLPGASREMLAQMSLGWSLVNMLQYTNNAVHFFLYCLTGPRFRGELAMMCRELTCKGRGRVANT